MASFRLLSMQAFRAPAGHSSQLTAIRFSESPRLAAAATNAEFVYK